MTSVLFSPIQLRGLTLANRIMVAPMCQYSATDGNANDWHLMHMGQFAVSGAGLFVTEATAVTAEGRISDRCLGLYTDENERTLSRVVRFCKEHGNVPIGIQLAHAGRKASSRRPHPECRSAPLADGAWQTVGPSAIAWADGWPAPDILDRAGMARIRDAFVDAVRRADRLGFDLVEIHGAHGYLLHQFLSPLSNTRSDEYGGTRENRLRFPLEVIAAMRQAWPSDKPLGVRVSATDWMDGGWDPDDTVVYAQELKKLGCDYIHVSSGGSSPHAKVPTGPGYQVALAHRVRAQSGLTTIAVGQISDPTQAETIVQTSQADMVALGRPMLFNPHWTWEAATRLGAQAAYPIQYYRAHPSMWDQTVPGKPAVTADRRR